MTDVAGSALRLAFVAATLAAAAPAAAVAQADFPRRAVKFVVPVPPGNMLDSMPRIIGEKLSARWSQPVIVENRPGAASNLGTEAVVKSEPDGYTLLVSPPGPLSVSQHVYPKLGFDPMAFVPVTTLIQFPFILVVNAKAAGTNLRGVDRARQGQPGQDQLRLARRQQDAAPPDGTVFGGGRHQVRPRALSRPRAGDARPARGPYRRDLRHARKRPAAYRQRRREGARGDRPKRIPELPNVPAIAETLPGIVHTDWFAVVAPPKTPPEIATRLSQDIAQR